MSEFELVRRTYWTSDTVLERQDYEMVKVEKRTPAEKKDATLVSSLLKGLGNMHAPALDIDMPCRLVPSSTEGHFHLFIDKPMSWRAYRKLLKALKVAGIIEPGYYGASVNRKMTMLRLPHVKKGDGHLPSETVYG